VTQPEDGLSIGELARRTGVPAATLRSWEDRYGFPRPQRMAGGHRRYAEDDSGRIEEILRLRASGLSLHAAIGQAAAARAAQDDPSVFAGLRRRHPGLVPLELRKTTLLAITRAIEDECSARAGQAALFAGFQQVRYYRQSGERWRELARTARVVVIFADFGEPSAPGESSAPGEPSAPAEPSAPGASPLTVRLPPDSPLRREWFLVCAAPDFPAFVAGWEFPGQQAKPDAARRFEVLWSVDPPVVRDAAVICAQLARTLSPGLDRLLGDLPGGSPPPASADLNRAIGLFNRMANYLDRATPPRATPPRP
jgi:MerR family transcriptional regulator, light-induced transcriptional regulator